MIKRILAIAALAGAAFSGVALTGASAQAETCSSRTTHYVGTTASGNREATVAVTRTCGDVKVEGFKGSYAYRSGETATEVYTERWNREGGSWIVAARHETRVAHYATGRTTTTVTNRVGCHETRVTTSVTGAGTRTTTTNKTVC